MADLPQDKILPVNLRFGDADLYAAFVAAVETEGGEPWHVLNTTRGTLHQHVHAVVIAALTDSSRRRRVAPANHHTWRSTTS